MTANLLSDRLVGDLQRTIQQSRQQTEQQRSQESWSGPSPQRPLLVMMLGKVSGSPIAAGGSGTVEIYTASGTTWTDANRSVTAYDPRTTGADLAVGHRVYLTFISGQWFIIDADPCAP